MAKMNKKNPIKSMVIYELKEKVEQMLVDYEVKSHYLVLRDPSLENEEQLRCMKAACEEIRQQLDLISEDSTYESDQRGMSMPAGLIE